MCDYMKKRAHLGIMSETTTKSCLHDYIKNDKIFRIFRITFMNLDLSLKEKQRDSSRHYCLMEKVYVLIRTVLLTF